MIPVGRLLTWLFNSNFYFDNVNLFGITLNTIFISLVSCIFIIFIAYFINFTRNYYNNKILKKISQLAILGYSIPGAIIAIGILKLNSSINELSNVIIIGSIFGLVFAYLVRFLAVAWQPIQSSMKKQCTSIHQASRTLNGNPIRSSLNINLPILKKPLLLTSLILFIDISKELPLTLILRPFNVDTLATFTYDLINQAHFFQSALPSILIILISLPAIFIINREMGSEV